MPSGFSSSRRASTRSGWSSATRMREVSTVVIMPEMSPTDVPSPVYGLQPGKTTKTAGGSGQVFIAGHPRPPAGRWKAYDLHGGVEVFLTVLLRSPSSYAPRTKAGRG